ncbi:hypothetical protein O1L55_04400 [Streptomyces albulus]|nr:hypothetical protein [Streptomyces noursei]
MPQRCGARPARDPRAVFDVFWQTYAENYPFFRAKGIDWRAVRDRYRPRITAATTDAELFAVLRAMIEPLHDAHTGSSPARTGGSPASAPAPCCPPRLHRPGRRGPRRRPRTARRAAAVGRWQAALRRSARPDRLLPDHPVRRVHRKG